MITGPFWNTTMEAATLAPPESWRCALLSIRQVEELSEEKNVCPLV